MAQLHFLPPRLRTPSLVFIHGIEIWEHSRPSWLNACRSATTLVSNSNFTKQHADQLHGGFQRTHVCWLATESDDLPKTGVIKSTRPTALIVSRIDANEGYKGHQELIEVWPEVLQAVPNACLRIVGRGSGLQAIQALAAQRNLQNYVQFDGFVSESDLEQVYLQSHVFAMPSRGEGFGLVYIEAMRCGLPVITSLHDAGQEVIEDGVSGYAVDLSTPNSLRDRLISLLSNPDHATAMGRAGQARWQAHFTPSRFISRFQAACRPFLGLN